MRLLHNGREIRETVPLWDGFLCEASATGSVDGIASAFLFHNGREIRETVPLWKGKRQNRREVTE